MSCPMCEHIFLLGTIVRGRSPQADSIFQSLTTREFSTLKRETQTFEQGMKSWATYCILKYSAYSMKSTVECKTTSRTKPQNPYSHVGWSPAEGK